MRELKLIVGVGLMLLGSSAANAIVVTSIPGAAVQTMPASDMFSSGPITFGDGVTWSASTPYAVFGWTNGYGFSSNGVWFGAPPMAGTNMASGTMTFTLPGVTDAIGGVLNWSNDSSSYYPDASMSVYDSSNNLLETYSLTVAGVNVAAPDSFYGFYRPQDDIHSFVLTDAYIGLRSLTFGVPAVPEPATWALMLLGFGGIGLAMRRQNQAASASA